MNKQKIIKWSKRISIAVCSIIGIYFLIVIVYFINTGINENYLIPMKCKSLYKQGLAKEANSDSIALVLYNLGEEEKAIALLKNTATKGRVSSQVLLGELYEYDNDKSSFWYLKAAQGGNPKAQGKIGHNYFWGSGVSQNIFKAIYWIKKGADGGDADAQYQMGTLYSTGVALYDLDYSHKGYIYMGNNTFRKKSLDDDIFGIKINGDEFKKIMNNPYYIYLRQDINKAKYYWKLASNQGLQEAEDALEKIYD